MVRRSSRLAKSNTKKDECKKDEESIVESTETTKEANNIVSDGTSSADDESTKKRAAKTIKPKPSVARRKSTRSTPRKRIVTPSSSTVSNEKSTRSTSTRKRNINETKTDIPPSRKRAKKNSTEIEPFSSKSDNDSDYEYDDDDSFADDVIEIDDESIDEPIKAKSTAKKTRVIKTGRRITTNNNNNQANVQQPNIAENDIAGQPDGNGGLNRKAPYKVTYASSGRATCRRCDEIITKGSPRTTHKPLFRGKPGFEVHRHLKCTIFTADVLSLNDVSGYEDLKEDDLEMLKQRIKESQEEMKQELEELHPDELTPLSYDGPIREPPDGLTALLLPFQKEGTSWMYQQEVDSSIKGGILADEMGMGKTLQSITLILDHMPKLQHAVAGAKHSPDLSKEEVEVLEKEEEDWEEVKRIWMDEFNKDCKSFYNTKKKNPFPYRGGTLVICPVIALYQWKSEIEKFTNNKLKVCIYHGPNRSDFTAMNLSSYDIILTTYNVIESDYRKMVVGTQKISCPNCGKKFKLDKLHVHLKYFCGDGAQKTEAQARQRRKDTGPNKKDKKKAFEKGTKEAKKKKTAKKKSFDEDYDSDSDESFLKTNEDDINELIKQHQKQNPSNASILHGILWWRIILDEAHYIKSRSSQTSASAFALSAIHRWCLSGTPLQNRVGEFYSLIRFLRIDPMGYYYCKSKGCDCASLHYKMHMGRCTMCNCSSIQHYAYFNKHVLNPIQRDGYQGDGRRAMFLLKNSVLDKCLLRRTKSSHAEDMNLPPRCVSIQFVKLHPIEEDFYNALYTQTRSSFNDYVADGTLLNNYAHIFDLLVRMRQAVCHPYLVVFSKRESVSNMASSYHQTSQVDVVANGSTDCEICHEAPTDRILSTCCKSAFCKSCVMEYMTTSVGLSSDNIPCPSCNAPFSIDLNQPIQENPKSKEQNSYDDTTPTLKQLKHIRNGSILRRIDLAQFTTSTKIEALMSNLVTMRHESPASKAIVFSQFTNMLDLIRWRIHSDEYLTKELGLNVVQVHGGLDVNNRNKNLNSFQSDSNVRVLLISLKAGGVALNLTRANYIYLMDPWWNPAAEMQAIDRTHRLGQYRPIRAVRFIAENTVEERILQLQEKKRLVFDGTVGRDATSLTALSVDDMKCLFT